MIGYRTFFFILIIFVQFVHCQDRIALPIPEPLDLDLDESIISENELGGKTYQELEALRSEHEKRVNTLISGQKFRESPKGFLELLATAEVDDLRLLKTENRIRKKMFERIGSLEGRSTVSVGREFYRSRNEGDQKAQSLPAQIFPSLCVIASGESYGSLASDLAKGFLKSVGYNKVSEKGGDMMVGQRAFGDGYIAVKALETVPTNLEEVNYGVVTFESGRVAGEIPGGIVGLEGLAIVVNRANPMSSLSMAQVGNIFSGKTSNWSSYRKSSTESISVVLPGQDKSLVDLLNVLVMDPLEVKATDGATISSSGDYLQEVRSNPAAISICRVGDIPSDMNALVIRSGSASLPIAPTMENVLSLDYPFIRYVRVKDVGAYGANTGDFIKFASRSYGQKIIANAGIGSIEWSNNPDKDAADRHLKYLFASNSTPYTFKKLVEGATRHQTPVSFRFKPKTKTFELDEYSKTQLVRLSEYMRKESNGKTVMLLGYADNEGGDSANRAYSKKRADSVATQLKELGVANVITAGIGEDLPVGNNNTRNGRAANRRVEVWLK